MRHHKELIIQSIIRSLQGVWLLRCSILALCFVLVNNEVWEASNHQTYRQTPMPCVQSILPTKASQQQLWDFGGQQRHRADVLLELRGGARERSPRARESKKQAGRSHAPSGHDRRRMRTKRESVEILDVNEQMKAGRSRPDAGLRNIIEKTGTLLDDRQRTDGVQKKHTEGASSSGIVAGMKQRPMIDEQGILHPVGEAIVKPGIVGEGMLGRQQGASGLNGNGQTSERQNVAERFAAGMEGSGSPSEFTVVREIDMQWQEKAVEAIPPVPVLRPGDQTYKELNNYAVQLERHGQDVDAADLAFQSALEAADSAIASCVACTGCERCGNGTLARDRPAMLCNYAQFLTDKRKDKDLAESHYLRALSLDPTNADTLVRYAVFLEVFGDFPAAERLLRQATSINQTHVMGLLNLAVLFETVKHDYTNAEWYYKTAYQVDSMCVPLISNYGHFLHVIKQDYTSAEAFYKRALAIQPNHINSLCNYGYLLHHVRGDYEGAEALYKQVLQCQPSHEGALINYAVLLSTWGNDYTAAESLYRSALMYCPTHIVGLTNYAHLLHFTLGKKTEAEEYYKRALHQSPEFSPALVNYGLLLEQQERYPEAEEMYRRAMEADDNAGVPMPGQTTTCLEVVPS